MENSLGNSNGEEIPRKSRSLDLKSLYKSEISKQLPDKSLKRKYRGVDDDEKKKLHKKSRKAVSISSLKNVDNNGRKSLEDVYNGGLGSHDLKDPKLDLCQKLSNGSGFNGISLSLDDGAVQIPKRKRGFVGRSKFESSQVLKSVEQSTSKVVQVTQRAKVTSEDSDTHVQPFKGRLKKGLDDIKENRSSESNSSHQLKERAGQSAVSNGESSLKKSRSNHRKRKVLQSDSKRVVKEVEPLVDTAHKVADDLQEDDEENLEENAARMLSSRFDTSCAGFSSNNRVSEQSTMNGLSFLLTSGQNFVSRGSKSLSRSESAVDSAGRVLRPRKYHKEKGNSRKRRHFYEIFSRDLDADWVLNRRIKVFWPLDKSWYYGLVNDYDKERKLHHVKYDDRDEEWINLQNERFKLLLLPSEVPGKAQRKRSQMRDKHSHQGKGIMKPSKDKEKGDLTVEDDSCTGSYMDSEPIISWLARSTHRVKSSPFHTVKKQKTSGASPTIVPQLLSDEAVNADEVVAVDSFRRDWTKTSGDFASSDRLTDVGRENVSASNNSTCPRDTKLPIVYFRRRFHRRGKVLCYKSEDNNPGRGASEIVTSLAPAVDGFGGFREHDILRSLDSDMNLWSMDNLGVLKLSIPLVEQKQFKFALRFPVLSVLNYSFGAEQLWLFRTVLLLHYGTVVNMWPRVHLEMLFVDNLVGLRFVHFEGCLEQAVGLVFWVLTTLHQSNEQGKYADPQLPVTSVRFKLSCIQDLRKQLVFAFYNFSEVKNTKWMYLDCMLRRHCLLTRQLPLSECTYDNIKAVQNGTNQLLGPFVCGDPSPTEGFQKRCWLDINPVGVSKDPLCCKIGSFSLKSDKKRSSLPPFALSFAASPTFFLSLHLKLLMERSLAQINFPDPDSMEHLQNSSSLVVDDCSSMEDCSNTGSKNTTEKNLKASSDDATCNGCLSCTESELRTNDLSGCGDGHWIKSSEKCQNNDPNVTGISSNSHDPEEIGSAALVPLQKWQCQPSELEQCVLSPSPSVDMDKANVGSNSLLSGIRVEIPQFDQIERNIDKDLHGTQPSADLTSNMNGGVIPSSNPTAPRSTWHRNRSSSPSFGYLNRGWSDRKADFQHNHFGNGPKKPRTQVSYSLPFGGFDYGSRNRGHNQKGPHKRIRRANDKRSADVSRALMKNLELLSCDANVLVTLGDRGWRECGAQIVLELFEHNEWKLSVKVSGATRYSYKAHQFLQPGSTNRYTHAMMWKGGKDWILEFPDRSQWALFKEMYEECYNRNIRAASVKNIPIPGVHSIEEHDDNGIEVAFLRSSKYLRQIENDVEMALDPSRVLYDMDSDDEQCILKIQESSEIENNTLYDTSEEMFEKTMDMFEKAAYVQQRDQFTSDEIEELMAGVGSMEVIRRIYEHWRLKRHRKGMPLIRHLQPPLWERYQQQVREWELAMTKLNTTLPTGCQEKVATVEKPAMFAFCLKPRGLEVPNRGSKQRSQKKFSVSGQNNTNMGDHDGLHAFGRRYNGFALGDEKVSWPGHNYETLEESPLSQTSPGVFSLRASGSLGYFSMGGDGYDRNHPQKFQRSKSKKFGPFVSSKDVQMEASYNQILMGKRNGIHQWDVGYSEWSSPRLYCSDGSQMLSPEQLDGPELDEFRLRDASGAAQHALNKAKLKRERAQRLLYRADVAIHKAVVSLMVAEAIKASSEDFGDGLCD